MSDYEPQFEEGNEVNVGADAPMANIERVFQRDGRWKYEITWSNGNETENSASRIDGMAKNVNTSELEAYELPPRFQGFANYMDNMVGMEFTRKRRRELLSMLSDITEDEVHAYSCELHTDEGFFDKLTYGHPEELYSDIPGIEVKAVKQLTKSEDEDEW